MFIITDENSVIKYLATQAPDVLADRIKLADFDDGTLNASNCKVIETAAPLPADWMGNKYVWDSGFVLNPAYVEVDDVQV